MFTCNGRLCFLLRAFLYNGQIAGGMKSLKKKHHLHRHHHHHHFESNPYLNLNRNNQSTMINLMAPLICPSSSNSSAAASNHQKFHRHHHHHHHHHNDNFPLIQNQNEETWTNVSKKMSPAHNLRLRHKATVTTAKPTGESEHGWNWKLMKEKVDVNDSGCVEKQKLMCRNSEK